MTFYSKCDIIVIVRGKNLYMSKKKERERIIKKWDTFFDEGVKKLKESDLDSSAYGSKLFQLNEDVQRAKNIELAEMYRRRRIRSGVATVVVSFATPLVISYLIQAGMSSSYQVKRYSQKPIETLPHREETMPENPEDNDAYYREM